jgi:AhpD family alkylhydroperoxidase
VKAVFDDIRATRQTDFVNSFWRTLAFDPGLLERTWAEVKQVMATASLLDPVTKEMIFIAVSAANACSYCVHSHTAAAKAKGMTDAQYGELLSIIAVAGKTNQLANTLQVPVDAVFNADQAPQR